MSRYRITLEDGRTLDVLAPSETEALAHAKKDEAQRVGSERTKLTHLPAPDFSPPVSAVKIKD